MKRKQFRRKPRLAAWMLSWRVKISSLAKMPLLKLHDLSPNPLRTLAPLSPQFPIRLDSSHSEANSANQLKRTKLLQSGS